MVRYVNVKTGQRNEFVDITGLVERELKAAGIKSGVCYIYVPHTTAGITINEGADPSVQRDIITSLSRLIPRDMDYLHMEGNSDAHIKSSIVGVSTYVYVDDGKLVLGTWQSIYFCEFDGPRHRRVALRFIKG
jgi:secondary thiamine-phosphate synthase enzyme